MAEWTYALASVDELKDHLSVAQEMSGQDPLFETILKTASQLIEAHLGRKVVSRGSITEYHTFAHGESDLWLLQWPVISITTVKEGGWVNGTWTADATLLTTNGEYLALSNEDGARLVRMNSGSPTSWDTGFEAVEVVYTAGYATTSAVPQPLKIVCLDLAARKYSQIRRGGDFSAQTVSDGLGTVSRFLPAELLRIEQEVLFGWRNMRQGTTGRAL